MNTPRTGLRVLIVDDEPPARARLRALLAEHPGFAPPVECGDGLAALERLASEAFDLVLLDVRMPGCSGLDVVQRVGAERLPPIVFVTAHDEHAVRAFELCALDYLLKPFDRARFAAMLARARRAIDAREGGALAIRLEGLLAELARVRPEPLVLRTSGHTAVVDPTEIRWVEAADNYVRVHARGRELLVRGTLGALETRLEPHGFLRIHRSRLVHPDRVRALRPLPGGETELELDDGTRLVAARAQRRRLVERWPDGLR